MNAIDRRREAFIDEMFMYAMLVVVIGIAALFFMWDHGRTASANARNGCETAGQWVVLLVSFSDFLGISLQDASSPEKQSSSNGNRMG